jgi:hypothetical protein
LVKVRNTKVVANIQIYLHAMLHISLRSLSIPFQFISYLLEKSKWKREIKLKQGPGRFPPRRLVIGMSRPIFVREPGLPSALHHHRLQMGPACRGYFPPIFPCSAPAWRRRQNCHRQAGHPSPPLHYHDISCRIISSCRVASCPYCRCSAAAVTALDEIPHQELGDEASHSPFRWPS